MNLDPSGLSSPRRDGRMMKPNVRDETSVLSQGLISLIPNMHHKSKHHKNLYKCFGDMLSLLETRCDV